MPSSAAEWKKVLTTPAPGAPPSKGSKYAGMTVNAAYNLGALEETRKDFKYLGQVFKDPRTIMAVKNGKGSTSDFVNDMNVMYQASQASKDELKKLESAEKAAVVKALGKYSALGPLTSQLLGSYKDEGVLEQLPAIASEVEMLIGKVLKEVNVEIVAAAPLTDKQKAQILSVIQKYVASDAKLLLTEKVDTSLIAGFQLLIEDRFVDLSAKKSLDNLMSKVAL
eukprot:CAMPEP_0114507908 /NCGR_PEP_ID=MMETSP0109-20121206/12286_1 /TAXON_ID=29199 /ORGANISM="Chlorarachnion reptans, Strain CCCM449" /LENGTH=223 /DNA_ID=CAMNT_0001686743 /DNA_START=165 /DNA_END=836 /DNA_ORIENTATION=+